MARRSGDQAVAPQLPVVVLSSAVLIANRQEATMSKSAKDVSRSSTALHEQLDQLTAALRDVAKAEGAVTCCSLIIE